MNINYLSEILNYCFVIDHHFLLMQLKSNFKTLWMYLLIIIYLRKEKLLLRFHYYLITFNIEFNQTIVYFQLQAMMKMMMTKTKATK